MAAKNDIWAPELTDEELKEFFTPFAKYTIMKVKAQQNEEVKKDEFRNKQGTHAEKYFCKWLTDELEAPLGRWNVQCWMNYSSCSVCADRLVKVVEENKGLQLSLKFVALYTDTEPNSLNGKGLRNMDKAGIKVAVMDENDYRTVGKDISHRAKKHIEKTKTNFVDIIEGTDEDTEAGATGTDHSSGTPDLDLEQQMKGLKI